MENLRFKCKVCQNIIEMKKEIHGDFSDWAYDCAEWSDFKENVPELSERYWERSECTPVVNENRTILVYKPFDEKIGNEFWLLYEPALLYLNGWEGYPEEDIRKCAVVRCRFEKILVSDEYSAWIVVNVQQVVFLHELYKYYEEVMTDIPIDEFEGIPKTKCMKGFQNDKWLEIYWTAQGDCGDNKWIYTDEYGMRHLVMQMSYGFDDSVLYIGNITELKKC
ncbi:MAG: hypothetical protein K2N27_11940 [Ruminococcus sp.]|nr:hypothetical protein [Ruminococcus sp.]